jgi:tetratricopeptide (TPR) repeat protein
MPQVFIRRNGVEVIQRKRGQLIEWGAIREWRIAAAVDYKPRTGEEIVTASVISIGYERDEQDDWFHVDNQEIGERPFMALFRALRKQVPKKGPANVDGVPPHVRAARERKAAAKRPKPTGGKAAKRQAARVGEWPGFDQLGSDRDELMRQFMQLGPSAPRRPKALVSATKKKIDALAKRGAALEKQKKLADAWAVYGEAFALIPDPKINWEATPWLLSVGADVAFQSKQYPRALGMLNNAVNCTAPDVNPFVNLRIGQCLYELGDKEQAAHYLTLAYMAEGRDILREDDPKYFRLLEKVLKPPKGRKRL